MKVISLNQSCPFKFTARNSNHYHTTFLPKLQKLR